MRYSITMVMTDRSIGAVDLARAVEASGLDGIWLPDHSHIPVSRTSPYPIGGDLPERYKHMVDPLIALAMMAAVTDRIRLGTGVMLAAQREPIVTAKALATLDQQSAGRLTVGVGYGWNVEEMADHGVAPSTRRARVREHVLAMQSLWHDDVATYSGEHVHISPSWSWPKPVQDPLPVLIGGAPSDRLFADISEFGRGWMPLGRRALREGLPRLRERWVAAGRDANEIEVVSFNTMDLSRRDLEELASLGATEIALDVPPADLARVHHDLDAITKLVHP